MDLVIVGGGVSGLSLAYFCLTQQSHATSKVGRIRIFERNDGLGGYARNDIYGNEHSPRVVLPGYKYFKKICENIPEIQKHMIRTTSEFIGYNYSLTELLKVAFMCSLYVFKPLKDDSVTLGDVLLGCGHMKKGTLDFIRGVCAKLGAPPEKLPVTNIIHLAFTILYDIYAPMYTFDGPYQSAFFGPLERYLTQHGVTIFKKTSCVNIGTPFEKNIRYITVEDENTSRRIYADKFVFALDVGSLAELFPVPIFKDLREKTYDGQMGIRIVFKKKLENTSMRSDYITFSGDWGVIVHRREKSYSKEHGLDHSDWSMCLPYVDSNYSTRLKKTIVDCSKEEILEEVIYQISQHIDVSLGDVRYFNVWDAWVKDLNNKWVTYEPYFSSSKNTYHLRPDHGYFLKGVKNALLCGAITKTSYNSWYMEGAAESGYLVAKLLC